MAYYSSSNLTKNLAPHSYNRLDVGAENGASRKDSTYEDVGTDFAPPSSTRKIRVLHSVGHLLRGGIERWLYDLINRLERSRYEHHVLVWTNQEQEFTAEFEAAGVKVISCPSPRNPIEFARNFRRAVRNDGPYDIIHTHGTHFHGYVLFLARILGVENRIAHSHTDIRVVLAGSSLPYRLYAALGHASIRKFAKLGFGVSELAAESMFSPGWREDGRWRVLNCGVDLAPFRREPDNELRRQLAIPEGCTVVGHVGRFEAQKNHLFILDVAQAALERNRKLHFLLIGDGQGRADFLHRVQQRGLVRNFTFMRDCTDVPLYMLSAMDLFLFPSLYEGLGLAAVEAQAAGLPCLLSERLPYEVVVNPELTRRMPLAAGADAWAEALLSLPGREERRIETLDRLFVGSRHDVNCSARNLAKWYEGLVNQSV